MIRIGALLTIVFLFACSGERSGEQISRNENRHIPVEEEIPVVQKDASGFWILTEFHDSIAAYRRIGRYRLPIPVWTALVLRVDSDTVWCNGTLLSKGTKFPRVGRDTLLFLDSYGPQTFIHDPITDTVRVTWQNPDVPEHHGIQRYRRLRPEELYLLEGIDVSSPDRIWHFESNYHSHLASLLFEGRYEPLTPEGHAFRISAEGAIVGHPDWKKFWFHDYFGTMHPFEHDLDGLVFWDSSGNRLGFNWTFAEDTLTLRPMTTDGDFWYLAKGETRFLKRPVRD